MLKKRLSWLNIVYILGKVALAVIWAIVSLWILMFSFIAIGMTGAIEAFLFNTFLITAYLVVSYLAYKKFKCSQQTKKIQKGNPKSKFSK